MKKLQCEICGGQLMMKDGIAECQSCGMQFSKEEVKKMVVELSRPIKIDGEVKVTGVDDADALYRRAKDAERIGELNSAYETYMVATRKYPGDARLWLGWANIKVKLKQEACEKELSSHDGHYSDFEFSKSFMDLNWCNEIETLYARAQSLCGVTDEAQQGLLWFRNQKELLIQKYKNKKKMEETHRYWSRANAEFLNRRFEKKTVLPLLTGLTWKEIENQCRKKCDHFPTIKEISSWAGDRILIRYEYSYANDPDKDKGPTFDE